MEPSNSSSQETETKQEVEFRVYKRRWYILILFGLYAFTQSLVWNTWSPISDSSKLVFGWQNSTIAWMSNWGMLPFVLTGLLFMWLVQVKGLRWAILTSMFCVALGSSFRVITSEPTTATILIHIGQFINGVGGPISSGAIPVVSAIWFPPNERVTATAISNSLNIFGTAVGYILGPALVSDHVTNKSTISLFPHKLLMFSYVDESFDDVDGDNVSAAIKQEETNEIMRYMYYECGWSVLLLLVIIIYYPSKPPHPPSKSAAVERQPYWTGLYMLRKKGYFILIALIYGVSTGVFGGWTSVLYLNLRTVNVSETTAGWMGFYSTLAGCVASLIIGRFANSFVRHIRLFVLVLYIVTIDALILFSLMLLRIIPCTEVGLYVTIIVSTAAINIGVPLLYELACELAYPIGEGSSNGVLTLFGNFWGLVFLAVFSFPQVGTMWMNWAVIASTGVSILMLAVLRGRLNRLEVDEGIQPQSYIEDVIIVPEEFTDEDPLLAFGDAPSEVNHNILDVSAVYCGIQNPEIIDASAPPNEDSDVNHSGQYKPLVNII